MRDDVALLVVADDHQLRASQAAHGAPQDEDQDEQRQRKGRPRPAPRRVRCRAASASGVYWSCRRILNCPVLLVFTRSPGTGPAVTLSVETLLSASVGMANPWMVTLCVWPEAIVAIVPVCLSDVPPGSLSSAVTATFSSVTSPWFWTLTSNARSAVAGMLTVPVAAERDVAGLGDDAHEGDAVEAGELGRAAHAGQHLLEARRVERLGVEVVGGRGHRHVGDALLAEDVARRDVHAARVVRVRAAEVAGERRELGGARPSSCRACRAWSSRTA